MLREAMTKTMWITKWWSSRGIVRVDGCEVDDKYASGREDNYRVFARIGTDAFATEDTARANVVEKARAKLKSIARQKVKLENLITELVADEGNGG